ncbi:MAG: hypothetical protein H0X69_15800 [Gemmatimonadales bacterium]|jgi:hypothetical protein|nr:hypothetical protein [Gemmatimonadales bacterium]
MSRPTPSIALDDLPADARERLGLKAPRKPRRGMSKDQVRTHALRVLAVIAELSQADRRRVLEQALRANAV